jgi:hypothetical protein
MSTPIPTTGDTTFLGSYLINTRVYGVVVPAGQPPQFTATYEIQGDQGTMTIAAVIGPEGPAGASSFALTLEADDIDDPSDLPQTLTNTAADQGKFWLIDDVDANGNIIGSSMYVWYGTTFRRLMLGSPGPPGPVPIITPFVNLASYPGDSYMTTGGTEYEPTMTFNLAIPPGPEGPGSALALCPDVNEATAPVAGDVLGFLGSYVTVYLSPPQQLATNGIGSGGGLPAGAWYYQVTAISAAGESTPSLESEVTVFGSTSSVLLSWDPVESATGYKVYRGDASLGENALLTTINSGATVTYTDTGTAGTAVTPPTTNTASVQFPEWQPVSISQLLPSPYSMPEASFTAFSGISQRAPIGSFAIPPQSFPWTPIVWGHIGAYGVELSLTPLTIGCEVLLGDPSTGTLIARGFGNDLGEVNIMPHYSTPSNPGAAITPSNNIAVVPANNSNPAESTIYVNLYNDGELGLYQFSPTDAQIFVMVTPVVEG